MNDPNQTGDTLVVLIRDTRSGRAAQRSLEDMFGLPDTLKKSLRRKWLDALDRAFPDASPPAHGRLAESAYVTSIVSWFDDCEGDATRHFVKRLATLCGPEGPGDRILQLLHAVRVGFQAEDALATLLRAGLRQQTPQYANLLPPNYSQSDLVQEVTVKLLEWAVKEFHGHTDNELWAYANQRLEWRAIDKGRSGHETSGAEELEGFPGQGGSASEELIDRETRARIERYIDGWAEPDRLLFRLHHGEGLSYGKLAELLGRGESPESVKERVRALRVALRRHMRGE